MLAFGLGKGWGEMLDGGLVSKKAPEWVNELVQRLVLALVLVLG